MKDFENAELEAEIKDQEIRSQKKKHRRSMRKKAADRDNRISYTIREAEIQQQKWKEELDQKNKDADERVAKTKKE